MSKFSIDSTLVVIPARGGSKRIPNKNIKKISGQPMIYWPLMELKKIFSSQNILISTDSELIKERVEAKGLAVPFLRPEALSDDHTGNAAVVEHALDWYEANVKKVNFGHGGSSVKGKAMKIRKNNPKARKSFRARHNCDNPGPKTKARYWSCRKW